MTPAIQIYGPALTNRYIVEHALGGAVEHRFEAFRRQHEVQAGGTAGKALADPNTSDLSVEDIRVCQRSLRITTAACGKRLTGLDLSGSACSSPVRRTLRLVISAFPASVARLRRVDCFPNFSFSARPPAPWPPKP